MKIVLITLEYPPQKGGVASYYGGLTEELKRQGHEVMVISKGLLIRWFWPRWIIGYFTVRAVIKKEKPDILLAGHILPLGTVAYLLRKKISYGVFLHGLDLLRPQKSWRKRWLARKILKHAKLVVANSEFTKSLLTTSYILPANAIVVYPCPTIVPEVKQEDVESLRRRLGLTGKKVLLTLGRVVERKGHDLVIKALPEILQHVPEAVYVVAGDGPDLGRLQILVSSPRSLSSSGIGERGSRTGFPIPVGNDKSESGEGLQSAVRFVGAVSDEERPLYYALCDLFVMPSRQIGADVEGFGLSFLEAAAFGKPSVGGASGGQSEAILDGKTGALVDPTDASGLARVVVQLLRDDALRHELGQNAKVRTVHEFRWEKQIAKFAAQL